MQKARPADDRQFQDREGMTQDEPAFPEINFV